MLELATDLHTNLYDSMYSILVNFKLMLNARSTGKKQKDSLSDKIIYMLVWK